MINARRYSRAADYGRVGDFLIRLAAVEAPHANWHQSRWEYMHYHPNLDQEHLDACGIWEEDGEIVAVAHYEERPGVVYLELDPRHASLKTDLLHHAQSELAGTFKVGRAVHVYLDAEDAEFTSLATAMGFQKLGEERVEWTSALDLLRPLPPIAVAAGFRLRTLADADDVRKVHRVMHRGFNHPGEPPEEGLEERRRKLSAPNLRKDLTIVAVAQGGHFAAFAGMWYDAVNQSAYVEPVATDPDYRRLGLGTAVVLEGARRCAALGATVAYVGSAIPFYQAMGFRVCRRHDMWRKVLEPASSPSGA